MDRYWNFIKIDGWKYCTSLLMLGGRREEAIKVGLVKICIGRVCGTFEWGFYNGYSSSWIGLSEVFIVLVVGLGCHFGCLLRVITLLVAKWMIS